MSTVEFKDLEFKTLISIEKFDTDKFEYKPKIIFTTKCGKKYEMSHNQDCCESVTIEDVCGDLEDLLNTPILLAEEVSTQCSKDNGLGDSQTWTYYKLATMKGYVTIRWYGVSNGYYSESVDFLDIT